MTDARPPLNLVPNRGALGARPGIAPITSVVLQIHALDGSVRDVTARGALEVGRRTETADGTDLSMADPGQAIGGEGQRLALDDPAVSSRHASLLLTADGFVVLDLGSTNGTFVNGTRIVRPYVLQINDQVRFGGTTVVVRAINRPEPVMTPEPVIGRASLGRSGRASRPSGRPTLQPSRLPRSMALLDADPTFVEDRARVPLVVAAPPILPGSPEDLAARAAAAPKVVVPEPEAEPAPPVFPNYTERRRIIPIWAWFPVRAVLFVAYVATCVVLFVRPDGGLFFFWRLIVPLMPMLVMLAPGLWRNSCPIAAANQFPRIARFTRARTLPDWIRNSTYLVPITLFLVIVPTRKVLLNTNGPATALMLLAIITAAFVGGVVYKGKSGWCSQFCPMLPLERLYGQTPFVTLPNAHCQPCVGCTKNCYDFNPGIAYQADMADSDQRWSGPRKLFAGALPGIIVGFAAFPSYPEATIGQVYLWFGLAVVVSIGIFFVIDGYIRLPAGITAAIGGAAAISLFYWYQAPAMAQAWGQVVSTDLTFLVWPLRVGAAAIALAYFVRTVRMHRRFVDQVSGVSSVRVELSTAKRLKEKAVEEGESVRFLPDDVGVSVKPGQSLLDAAEAAGVALEAGCRMGVCGADPIGIVEGASCLSAVNDDEAKTLRRLGLADNARMACCARLEGGEVTVTLEVEKGGASAGPSMPVDPTIRRVVIIGNGIAGVTTADFVRRNHPDCEIHVVAREPHPLYNRMGISRVVYGRTAMQGLYLLDDDWYDEHDITMWLNTQATAIVPASRTVALGSGAPLQYDRLVLAMGATGNVPSLPGWGLPGTFILREVQDAMALRAYVQANRVHSAVVAGAGLLGLEAAYALRELGLGVVVLDRGSRLLGKQCDERASSILHAYFDQLGIRVLPLTESAEVAGADRVEGVTLTSGVTIECGVFVVAAGNRPNTELLAGTGINVNRGVVVDARMETNIPGVYAVGDIAEHEGQMLGLWPIATEQAEVAAVNLLGGNETYEHPTPAAILKGVGIDMTSAGRYLETDGDEVIAIEGPGTSYRKLVVRDGIIQGGIAVGQPTVSPHLIKVCRTHADITPVRDALYTGDWSVLAKL